MADYVASNTRRLRVTYSGPRGQHVMLFRNAGLLSTLAGLIAGARAVVTEMALMQVSGTSWISAEYADEGSDIFLPATWGAAINAPGTFTADNTNAFGSYAQFTGKSTSGSRASFYIFNVATGYLTANNRLTPTELAQVTAICDAIEDSANGLCAIDKGSIVCKRYANTRINAHVARISRRAA
jgi:hypothetical protein